MHMPSVLTKMKVHAIIKREGGDTVELCAVYSSDPSHPNKSFADATPSATVSMTISKGRPAADLFEVGKEYLVEFRPA
jgi:hypothetical protein